MNFLLIIALALPSVALGSSLSPETLDVAWLSDVKYHMRAYKTQEERCFEYAVRINNKLHEGSTIQKELDYADVEILARVSNMLADRRIPFAPNGLVEYTNNCINTLNRYEGSLYRINKYNNFTPRVHLPNPVNAADSAEHGELNGLISDLRSELANLHSELNSARSKNNDQNTRIEELEKNLQEKDNRISQLQSELETEKKDHTETLMKSIDCIKDLDVARKEIDDRQNAVIMANQILTLDKDSYLLRQFNELLDERVRLDEKVRTCTSENEQLKATAKANNIAIASGDNNSPDAQQEAGASGECQKQVLELKEEVKRANQVAENNRVQRQQCETKIEDNRLFLERCTDATTQVRRYMVDKKGSWAVRCQKWDVFRKS